jgi:hypothetical protein
MSGLITFLQLATSSAGQNQRAFEMCMGLTKGFAWSLAVGLMIGGNLVPLQRMRIWKWENFWVVPILKSLGIALLSRLSFISPWHFGAAPGSAIRGREKRIHPGSHLGAERFGPRRRIRQ